MFAAGSFAAIPWRGVTTYGAWPPYQSRMTESARGPITAIVPIAVGSSGSACASFFSSTIVLWVTSSAFALDASSFQGVSVLAICL